MTGNRPVRVTLFGLGLAGATLHLPALRRLRGVQVVAVADPDPIARRHAGSAATFGDWRTALEVASDAVVVATPAETHAELASAALAAGKHVYVEKPMTTSPADAVILESLAATSGRCLQVGYAYRFHPLWQRLRSMADEGRLTPPFRVRARFSTGRGGSAWRAPVVDLAGHHVDALSLALKSPVTEVRATSEGQLIAHWCDGSELAGSYVKGPPVDVVEIEDQRSRTVTLDRIRRARLTGEHMGRDGLPDPRLARSLLSRSGWERSFEWALEAFTNAVQGEPTVGPGAREGSAAVAVAVATLRSLASGRAEQVDSLIPLQAP